MSLGICMLNKSTEILLVQRIYYVEEVISARKSALRYSIRHVLHELGNLPHVGPKILHRKLVEVGHPHHLHVFQRHEQLLLL